MIQESHPLQQLFVELVGRHYAEEIGIRDPQIVNYVAHLLGSSAKRSSCSRSATLPSSRLPTSAR